jgi:hypothetical protein
VGKPEREAQKQNEWQWQPGDSGLQTTTTKKAMANALR